MNLTSTETTVNRVSAEPQLSPRAAVYQIPNFNGWPLTKAKSIPPTTCTLPRDLATRFAIDFNASEWAKKHARWAVIFTSNAGAWSMLIVKMPDDQRPTDPASLPPGAELFPTVAEALHRTRTLNQAIVDVSQIAKVWNLTIGELADFDPNQPHVPTCPPATSEYRLGLAVNGVVLAESQPFQNRAEAAEALDVAKACLIPAGMEGGVA